MRSWLSLVLMLALLCRSFLAGAAEKASERELLISAAISLKPVLTELSTLYAKQKGAIPLRFNYAASGVLQRQIAEGAPVDIFLAAGEEPMKELGDRLESGWERVWLRNALVLAIPRQDQELRAIDELRQPRFKRIAMGDPQTVPAGLYAQDVLVKSKLEGDLKNKIVYAHNVRQVVTYLEQGAIQAGFVYATDLLGNDAIKVGWNIAADEHRAIVYPAAILKRTAWRDDAKRFLSFLENAESLKTFARFGFKVEAPGA